MELTQRQRRSLEAICDTFCPPANGLPGAAELGVPEAVLQLARSRPAQLRAQRVEAAAGALGHGAR